MGHIRMTVFFQIIVKSRYIISVSLQQNLYLLEFIREKTKEKTRMTGILIVIINVSDIPKDQGIAFVER